MLCDGNTFNYGYIGSRATGNEAGDYMVVGPDWKGETPAGIKKVFRSTTQFSLAAYRTQLFNPADMPNVVKVQAGYKVQPLSAYLKQPAPPAAPAVNFPKIDKELVKTELLRIPRLRAAVRPAGPEEKEIRAKLARIGIGAGKTFDFKDLSLGAEGRSGRGHEGRRSEDREVSRHRAKGHQRLEGRLAASAIAPSTTATGCKRAAAAKAGIYGNDAVEAMYPMTKTLANGEPLDGSKHNYTLTFAAGQLPPVNAFWSVTMYDGKTQLLIKNPINRYLINSPMLPDMKKNADGSLTLYIQKDSPGKDKEVQLAARAERPDLPGDAPLLAEDGSRPRSCRPAKARGSRRRSRWRSDFFRYLHKKKETNWLAAASGDFSITMRVYWPKPVMLKDSWTPPAVQRVEIVTRNTPDLRMGSYEIR